MQDSRKSVQDSRGRGRDSREKIQDFRSRIRDSKKEPENGKKRIPELDYYKGFLIYLVVLGHFLLPLKGSPHSLFGRSFYLIYSFHMPAFLFLSGYFFFGRWKKRGTQFRSLFSYFLLYLFMKCLMHIADLLFYHSKHLFPDFLHESSTPWYILVLLFLELSVLPLELFFKGKRGVSDRATILYLSILILLSFPLSFLEIGRKWKDLLSIDRLLSFAPFFYLGMMAKKKAFSFQKIHVLPCVLGGAFAVTLFLFFRELYPYTRVFYGVWGYRIEREAIAPFFKAFPILIRIGFFPYALCISYFFYTLVFFFSTALKRVKSATLLHRVLELLLRSGQYTLPIYVFHRPFRDAFFQFSFTKKFILGGMHGGLVLLFFTVLMGISFFLLFLLGRKSLDAFCRMRLSG